MTSEGGSTADSPMDKFVVLQGVQAVAGLDQPRKKRAHRKSKQGCVECRRRRVKCDEQHPCTNCIKRKVQCVRPVAKETHIDRSLSSPHFEADPEPQINLMHLELFHHFANETASTLSFPDVWPKLLQQSFHEEYIMSAILCTAACHRSALAPQDPRYSGMSLQLLSKSLRLLRQNLSRPFTKENSDSLMGCSLLMNYVSWTNLDFLNGPDGGVAEDLDLSRDQLFLLSPGVRHVYLQAAPVFLTEQSVFVSVAFQHPRLNIEDSLVQRGEHPNRFFEPLMRCWGDPRFQGCREEPRGETSAARNSWLFFVELEYEMAWERIAKMLSTPIQAAAAAAGARLEPATPNTTSSSHNSRPNTPVSAPAQPSLNTNASNSSTRSRWGCLFKKLRGLGSEPIDLQKLTAERTDYELVARRLSPILCCVSLSSDPFASTDGSECLAKQGLGGDMNTTPNQADFQRLFFSFPVLCGAPFLEMVFRGDSRALLLLFHFYRAARVLLSTRESWWAHERSRVMEGLILRELRGRGLTTCLRPRRNE